MADCGDHAAQRTALDRFSRALEREAHVLARRPGVGRPTSSNVAEGRTVGLDIYLSRSEADAVDDHAEPGTTGRS